MLSLDHLQCIVEQTARENFNPSISVTVFDNGEYKTAVTGYADCEKQARADKDTIYAIASSTKAFAATSVCVLAAKDMVDLDSPVRRYLPEFAMYDPYVGETLTVRDILCHRSGLPRHDITWFSHTELKTREQLLADLRYLKPFAPVRSRFYYSNHMFMLATHLVERVCGTKWETFLQQEILDKIGMKAYFHLNDLRDSPSGARPYTVNPETGAARRTQYQNLYVIGGAGCINASSPEMAKWIALQLAEGQWDGQTIVPQKWMRECHSPQMIVREMAGMPDIPQVRFRNYGLGWFVECYRGKTLVHHGGNIDGFSSAHFFLPGTGFGASILTNCEGSAIQSSLMYTLIDQYFDLKPINWSEKYRALMVERLKQANVHFDEIRAQAPAGKAPLLPLDAYTGTYSCPGYGDIVMSVKDGQLEGQYGALRYDFQHLGYDSYMAVPDGQWFSQVPAAFYLDRKGKPDRLHIDFEAAIGEPIVFTRQKG